MSGEEVRTMDNMEFEYGGYHFVPERQFEGKEKDFFFVTRRLEWDTGLGIVIDSYNYSKYPYSYEAFYNASTDKTCDIFRCVENGKLYVPCNEALAIYHEPPPLERKNTFKRARERSEKEER